MDGKEPDAEELACQLARYRRGLDDGRDKAIRVKQRERANKDQRMRNLFKTCRAAGWRDSEILKRFADHEQPPVQIGTARKRAKRLDLLMDELARTSRPD